ncbi:MAG: outer membrane protein assembly factor BamE [Bdellovibrionaceae bacterium]|nr:outer membrane protein assembly factor BamE [Pseudobdellovibrionaceae bacterium]
MKLLLFISLCLFLVSCQTNMAKQFDKIKLGSDKDSVLDSLGNPRNITRMGGEDRWYYMYYQDDIRQQKEIHFRDGLVIYVGERKKPTPEIDPVAVDAKNAAVNKQLDDEADRRKEASKNAYTNYMKYQKKLKKEDEVQYLPDFEPLE